MDVSELVDRTVRGDHRAIARAISLVENGAPELRAIMAGLAPHTGRARVVGLTGPPGVGKSTTTAALVAELRARGAGTAVLAVDPSSPFTGGALLGDRVRMQRHAADSGVFIRSMASRGHLGGLSWATPHALRVLDAAGFAVVLVETVGVGQAEVDIARHADTTVVLCAPGMGDGVQAAKAGVLEIADVFAVNKADRDGAHATVRELRQMVGQADRAEGEWRPPIVSTVAADGTGWPSCSTGSTPTTPTCGAPGSWSGGGGPAPARRSRRSPWGRCASAWPTCTGTRRWTRSPTGWPPAAPTPTPRPTPCSPPWRTPGEPRRRGGSPFACGVFGTRTAVRVVVWNVDESRNRDTPHAVRLRFAEGEGRSLRPCLSAL
jgi:LAO/AO transport system kinase